MDDAFVYLDLVDGKTALGRLVFRMIQEVPQYTRNYFY